MNALLLIAMAFASDLAALEEEMRTAHDEKRYITARRLADELLSQDPDNLNGLYVMGRVQWLSEGEHARAMHYLKEGDRVYNDGLSSEEERPWKVHSQILFALQNVAEEVGDYGYQLELMDRYDDLYDPPFTQADRAWAYMREDDMGSARASALVGISSEKVWDQVVGHNALCAIEAAAANRQLGLNACIAALEHRRDTNQGSLAVAAGNASGAAISALDFEQAEALAQEGTLGGKDVSAWRRLILMRVNQARMADSVAALRELRRSQAKMEPSMRDLRRADIDAAFAQLLLVAGETDKGLAVIGRALKYPDRRGLISTDEDQARGGHSLIRRTMRVVHRERLREQNSAQGLVARWVGWLRLLLPDPGLWADDAAIRGSLADAERLHGTIGVYLDDGLNDVPPWMVADAIAVIGAGVADAALQQVRESEDLPGMKAYYRGFDAEISLLRRRNADALEQAEEALSGFHQLEVLPRARLHAVAAIAAERRGDQERAMQHYGRLMQLDPGTARRMRLALPATVTVSGGWTASRVGSAIRRSPRFSRSQSGFQVSVEVSGDGYRACLSSPLGDRLGCADGSRPTGEEDEPVSDADFVMHIVTDFHDQVFAVPIGLSSVDLNSLDGTTTVRSEEERERLRQILDEL